MHLGTAFQIMDDVLDYSGDAAQIGKNLGDDLGEGKMTLPLIRALAVGTPEEADVIRHAIAGGGLTDFAPVVAALHRTGALDYARQRAKEESDAAAAAVAGLPRRRLRPVCYNYRLSRRSARTDFPSAALPRILPHSGCSLAW